MSRDTQNRRYDGIVFDKDGTLFDFARTWEAWAVAFLRRVADDDAHAVRLGNAIGFDVAAAQFSRDSVVIAGTPGEVAQAMLSQMPGWNVDAVLAMLNEEAARAPQQEAVPLGPFLDGLRAQGYVLGVATNDAETPARAHLDSAGVTERFDFIAGFDSGFGGKPAAGQLVGFCETTGCAPARCVMVGDSLHDLHAGRAAGFATVGVLTGFASAEELEPFAEVVLPDIGHLSEWLNC